MDKFEQRIRELTDEINGQYPRPWMTDLENPSCAEVFIVGYNQATAFRSNGVDYERFIDSLFNRNGEGCREFYEEYRKTLNDTTNKKKSKTRDKIEMFTSKLKNVGVYSILETNVICYGAKYPDALCLPEHNGGKARGKEIFGALVREIRPKAIILHGRKVCDEFSFAFHLRPRPKPPKTKDEFVQIELDLGVGLRTQLFVIRSLSPREFNKWQNYADEYLDEVSEKVHQYLSSEHRPNVSR